MHKREAKIGYLETLPRGEKRERNTDQNSLKYFLPFAWVPGIAHPKSLQLFPSVNLTLTFAFLGRWSQRPDFEGSQWTSPWASPLLNQNQEGSRTFTWCLLTLFSVGVDSLLQTPGAHDREKEHFQKINSITVLCFACYKLFLEPSFFTLGSLKHRNRFSLASIS